MPSSCPILVASSLAISCLPAQAFAPVPDPMTTGVFGSGNRVCIDFDGSGRPDLVYMRSNEVYLAPDIDLGSGPWTGQLVIPYQTQTGGNIGFSELSCVEDVDGDGILDIVTTYSSAITFISEVKLYLGTGGGAVAAPITVMSKIGGLEAAPGDFDGDGLIDIMVFRVNVTPEFEIYRQQPGTTFTLTFNQPMLARTAVAITGDYNGDGIEDVAYLAGGVSGIPYQVETFYGGATMTPGPIVPMPSTIRWLNRLPDVNGDGRDDMFGYPFAGTGATQLFYADASATWIPGPVIPVQELRVAADMDADGELDLVSEDYTTSEVVLHRGDGAGGFSSGSVRAPMNGGLFRLVHDLDGDGDTDILAQPSGGGGLRRLENRARYGSECAGTGGAPILEFGLASPGNAGFAVTLRNAAPGAICDVLVSLDGTAAPCGPQLDLMQLLQPASGFFSLITNATGAATQSLPIPAGLPVGPYFFQGAVIDPAGGYSLGGVRLASTMGHAIEVF